MADSVRWKKSIQYSLPHILYLLSLGEVPAGAGRASLYFPKGI